MDATDAPAADTAAPPRTGRRAPEARERLRLGVVVGSTRPDRRAPAVAAWVVEAAASRLPAAEVELRTLDLADLGLPLLDEPVPAAMGTYEHAHTQQWSEIVDACDGFLFVLPEYNHSLPAALKNALDYLHAEWHDKAAGIVAYGVDGGVRATEHLRLVLIELGVANVRAAVGLSLRDDFDDEACAPRPHQDEQLDRLLSSLLAWSHALRSRPGR